MHKNLWLMAIVWMALGSAVFAQADDHQTNQTNCAQAGTCCWYPPTIPKLPPPQPKN